MKGPPHVTNPNILPLMQTYPNIFYSELNKTPVCRINKHQFAAVVIVIAALNYKPKSLCDITW